MELDARNQGKNPLIHHPDISTVGYQVIRKLSHNREEGRITYLAYDPQYQRKVVIKESIFSKNSSDWYGLKTYERESKILQNLNHPRIPRYIKNWQTQAGFYLVQEYKDALPLTSKRSFHPGEIKQIAISILEILIYLQQQSKPIIHGDIKPENILVDEQLNAYLVDFGLAKVKGEKAELTSLVAGTPGFIPPEIESGYPLSLASDLYSLGTTLICLLTNTRSVNIDKLLDSKGCVNFQNLSPQIHFRFRSWLMCMVEPKWQYRYGNAIDALIALEPIKVTGNATFIEVFIAIIKLKRKTTLLGLAIVGLLAIAGTTLIVSQQGSSAQQLEGLRLKE